MIFCNFEKTVVSKGVADRITNDAHFFNFIVESLDRYINCDWGDTCKEDAESNNYALENDERILAVYIYRKGTPEETTIWIITEWDRSVTTILFPSEY